MRRRQSLIGLAIVAAALLTPAIGSADPPPEWDYVNSTYSSGTHVRGYVRWLNAQYGYTSYAPPGTAVLGLLVRRDRSGCVTLQTRYQTVDGWFGPFAEVVLCTVNSYRQVLHTSTRVPAGRTLLNWCDRVYVGYGGGPSAWDCNRPGGS